MNWIKTQEKLPCDSGDQADILMFSPEWATWLKGMVTVFENETEWSIYDQQNDKYYEWEHPPEFWMKIETP